MIINFFLPITMYQSTENRRQATKGAEALLYQLSAAAATARSAVLEQEEHEHPLPDFRERLQRSLQVLEPVGSLVRDQEHPMARRRLNTLVNDQRNIDFGHRAGALLQKLSDEERDLLRRVLVVTGHYESYINVEGVVRRKREMNQSIKPESPQFASAEQILAISGGMKRHYEAGGQPLCPDILKDIENIVEQMIFDGVRGRMLNPGGFYFAPIPISEYVLKVCNRFVCEQEPPPRVTTLSQIPEEYAFIAIHQMFETLLFEVKQLLTYATRSANSAPRNVEFAAKHMEAATKLFPILRKIISDDAFHRTIRQCFIVASAAQSRQYYTVQRQIGLPDSFCEEQHRKQLIHVIGEHAVNDIDQHMEGTRSLCSQHSMMGEPTLKRDIRRLVIANLQFKAVHGQTVCSYLDPGQPGSAGTQFTSFLAQAIDVPRQCAVFTIKEKENIRRLADRAVHRPHDPQTPQQSDCFEGIVRYLSEMSIDVPRNTL